MFVCVIIFHGVVFECGNSQSEEHIMSTLKCCTGRSGIFNSCKYGIA